MGDDWMAVEEVITVLSSNPLVHCETVNSCKSGFLCLTEIGDDDHYQWGRGPQMEPGVPHRQLRS